MYGQVIDGRYTLVSMLGTLEDFYRDVEKYITVFDQFAEKHSLIDITQADHICYKCDSHESFVRTRALFEHDCEYLFQSIISKRRIAYIKLRQGIETALGTIYFLELSDQKPDNSQKEKFDHIEVYPTIISYTEMVAKLEAKEQVIKVDRPHHTTHDIHIGENFLFRCTEGPLIEKIKNTEM